jgi:hypothetical protein
MKVDLKELGLGGGAGFASVRIGESGWLL